MDKATVTHGIDNIPDEMKKRNQWVVWNNTKVPINVRIGNRAEVDNPKTWSSFEEAREAVVDGKYKGPGFVFSEDDDYVGIDLDKVIDEDGKIDPAAQAIIDKMDSYTEVSQSGRGIHIIVRGKKPGSRCRKDNVEIYDCARYFALTGNLLDEAHRTLESRQEQLDSLYEKTFGESTDGEARHVDDLILIWDREPPEEKLEALLADNDFRRTWEYKKKSLKSMSEYDYRLACYAVEAGWSDQEIADLIIAFRETHGDKEDKKKSLRQDYISRTIAAAKKGSNVLELLPFKVEKVKQYGTQKSEICLVLSDGTEIDMGNTEAYISPRLAQARLIENQRGLPQKALKRWGDIILALQPLMEIVPTTTKDDDAKQWLDDYIATRFKLPLIKEDSDIKEVFGSGRTSAAQDTKGRLYLRLSDLTRYVRNHSGLAGVTTKSVARDLTRLEFKKRQISISEGEKRRQIYLWISPPGVIEVDEE